MQAFVVVRALTTEQRLLLYLFLQLEEREMVGAV